MSDINLIIRSMDRLKKAEITISDTQTCADIIQAAVDNWAWEGEHEYAIVNVSKTPPQTLNHSTALATAGVLAGETLEIQPALVAGSQPL